MREKGKGKRNGQVEMRRIENPIRRQITFSKRKAGLFKKAAELSLLCDVDLALIISSPSGKLYHSPTPKIYIALERYQKNFASSDCCAQDSKNMELLQLELEKGRKIETELEGMQKHMTGEDLDCLSFKELQHLEQQMKNSATKIRSRKEMLLGKHIKFLKKKLKMREDGKDHNHLEEGPINVTMADDQQRQTDGDANGVAMPQTNLQHHTNLSLSLF